MISHRARIRARSVIQFEGSCRCGADAAAYQTTKLFQDRLSAWKHACDYLSDYVGKTEKMQAAHAKEYEKVLKV